MPTFTCPGSIRESTDSYTLALNSRHYLVAGSTSSNPIKLKTSVPPIIDILHSSDITFTLSGVLAGVPVASTDMKKSAVVHHLIDYLQKNARALGIAHVSQLFIDEGDRGLKFTVSSCQCIDPKLWPVHATLIKIDLIYVYKSLVEGSPLNLNPFEAQAYLPLMSVLDRLTERFIVHHLVKRYPLVYGQWAQKVDLEMISFKPLCEAILNVVARSQSPSFRKSCHRVLRRLSQQYSGSVSTSSTALSDYLATTGFPDAEPQEEEPEQPSDYELLERSMLRLLKLMVRPSRFKGTKSSSEDTYAIEVVDIGDVLNPGSSTTATHFIADDTDYEDSSNIAIPRDDSSNGIWLDDYDESVLVSSPSDNEVQWTELNDDQSEDDDFPDYLMEYMDDGLEIAALLDEHDGRSAVCAYIDKSITQDSLSYDGDFIIFDDLTLSSETPPVSNEDILGLWLD